MTVCGCSPRPLLSCSACSRPRRGRRRRRDIQGALDAAYAKYKDLQEGKNADYIPALAKVDSNIYGIALVTTDGKVYTAGDVKSEVSIQSISKVFTMAKVIEEQGPDAIEKTIGVDATGMRFNSIVAVEFAQKALGGPEINPLVNPGAITATSMVKGATPRRGLEQHSRLLRRLRGPSAARSTRRSSSRRPTPTSATRRSAT